MTALLGNVEYAARHGADEEVLADLRHDARRLARLVDSLLALERAGEGTPELEPLRLDVLVRAAVDERDPGRVHIGTMDHATRSSARPVSTRHRPAASAGARSPAGMRSTFFHVRPSSSPCRIPVPIAMT